jgi:periplasmic solute binding protein
MILILMKSQILVLATVATLAFSGCASNTSTTDTTSTAAGTTKVSVAFYPLEYAATKVGGDKVSVTNLTLPGQEPHDLELSPQQIASLEEADLVVYLKGFQPAVDKAVEQSSAKHKLDLSQVIQLHPATEDHDHESEEKESEEHDHDHGDTDPHFWLDPTLEAKAAGAVADELSKIDASNKATYEANAKTLTDDLTSLDGEYKSGLANCRVKTIITTHAAFGYLAERYGLEQIGISGISPNAQPSPARIAKVQEEAKEHGVSTIFFETLTSDEVAQAIAGDLGLKTAVLDPIEGITDASAGQDYPAVMRANLATLKQANGCS